MCNSWKLIANYLQKIISSEAIFKRSAGYTHFFFSTHHRFYIIGLMKLWITIYILRLRIPCYYRTSEKERSKCVLNYFAMLAGPIFLSFNFTRFRFKFFEKYSSSEFGKLLNSYKMYLRLR